MTPRRKIVAGNWKMNTLLQEAVCLSKQVAENTEVLKDVEVIVCVPYPFIIPVIQTFYTHKNISAGAQNCSEHISGAYTGEVSAAMLRSTDCSYVIVGHSERRIFFNETDAQLSNKIQRVLENNLQPIFCVGEKKEERESTKHFTTVESQLSAVLSVFNEQQLQRLIIAYEPVWAIGTGLTASSLQAQEMHAHIRKVLASLFTESFAQKTPLLYGGSCNAQNAAELFACNDVDGGLIGGASLKADDFCKIMLSF